jgi:hypothetical protein
VVSIGDDPAWSVLAKSPPSRRQADVAIRIVPTASSTFSAAGTDVSTARNEARSHVALSGIEPSKGRPLRYWPKVQSGFCF